MKLLTRAGGGTIMPAIVADQMIASLCICGGNVQKQKPRRGAGVS